MVIMLALNTMVQPSGSVLGSWSRHHLYLRGSPIICVVDVLYLFGAFIIRAIYSRSSYMAAKALVSERFQEEGREGILALKASRHSRWLGCALGPLLAAIQLASLRGIPNTQLIGASYMVSFLITEGIILLASEIGIENDAEISTTQTFDSQKVLISQLHYLLLEVAIWTLFMILGVAVLMLVSNAVVKILPLRNHETSLISYWVGCRMLTLFFCGCLCVSKGGPLFANHFKSAAIYLKIAFLPSNAEKVVQVGAQDSTNDEDAGAYLVIFLAKLATFVIVYWIYFNDPRWTGIPS